MAINAFGYGKDLHIGLLTIPYFKESERASDLLFTNFSFSSLYANAKDTIGVLFFNKDTIITNNFSKYGPIYHITNAFFFLGLIGIIRAIKDKETSVKERLFFDGILSWLFMGIWIGLVTNGILIHRINVIFYVMLIISSYGIWITVKKIRITKIIIIPMYLILFTSFIIFYFRGQISENRYYFNYEYLEALEKLEETNADYYVIYPYPDERFANAKENVGEILTLYSHEIDALYYQGKSNIQGGVEQLPYKMRYNYLVTDNELIRNNKGKQVAYLVPKEAINTGEIDLTSLDLRYENLLYGICVSEQ